MLTYLYNDVPLPSTSHSELVVVSKRISTTVVSPAMEQSRRTSRLPQDEPAMQRASKRNASDPEDCKTTTTDTNDTTDDSSSSPLKRRCTSTSKPKSTSMPNKGNTLIQLKNSQLPLHSILHLPETALWSLCKSDIRSCFLALQTYARSPYPLSTIPNSTYTPASHASPQASLLLRLPREIRQHIYALLLPLPVDIPMRGPHPRQLQNSLHFTQPIPSSLLLLNHQIRMEALPVLYGAPTQVAHVVIDYNLWLHKTARSDLVLSPLIPSSLRHIHITLSLGNEKKPLTSHRLQSSSSNPTNNSSPSSPAPQEEAATRLLEIKKGVKKLLKWLGGADVKTLRVSWQEPPQTYSWAQKREVLEGLRAMRAESVVEGEINWGLEGKGKWNRGRKYRWEEGWVGCLARGREWREWREW